MEAYSSAFGWVGVVVVVGIWGDDLLASDLTHNSSLWRLSVAVDVVGMEPRLYHLDGDREGDEKEAASQLWSSSCW